MFKITYQILVDLVLVLLKICGVFMCFHKNQVQD